MTKTRVFFIIYGIANASLIMYGLLALLTGPSSQPLANEFSDFVLSSEGRKYVDEFGWISINK